MLVLMCILIPVSLAIAAFVINVAYIELSRTEMQIATDTATRAAGRMLSVTRDENQAIQAAERMLQANPIANKVLPIGDTNINFGVSTRYSETERYQFNSGRNPNAVQLDIRGVFDVPPIFPTMGVPITIRPKKTSISTQTVIDLVLVVDRSSSMAYFDFERSDESSLSAITARLLATGGAAPPKSRWCNTVIALNSFLQMMQSSSVDSHIALCTNADTGNIDVQLTRDFAKISRELDKQTLRFDGGLTNLSDGLLDAASHLSDSRYARPWASRVILLLSDGLNDLGTDPLQTASLIASENVAIFTVSLSDEANISLMSAIAKVGCGKHNHLANSTDVASAFEDITSCLPTLITQ